LKGRSVHRRCADGVKGAKSSERGKIARLNSGLQDVREGQKDPRPRDLGAEKTKTPFPTLTITEQCGGAQDCTVVYQKENRSAKNRKKGSYVVPL